MKKIISIFIIFVASFIALTIINAEEYEEFKSGDLVRYKDIAFYVLFDSDSTEDSVQLLKMVPLTHEEINKYTDNKAYMSVSNSNIEYDKSDDTQLYGNMAFYYSDGCYNWLYYDNCVNDYSTSNVKKVVDLWVQESINVDDIVEFEDGNQARLMSASEISVFDTTLDISNNSSSYYLKNIPNWLSSHNYYSWTMNGITARYTTSNNDSYSVEEVYTLHSERYSNISNYFMSQKTYSSGTVRPTLILKKNSISKVTFNEYHNNAIREYKIGDIINYNDTKFYVIKDSSESDSTVTLLKDKPLTKYELETYGEGYINNYIYKYNSNNVTPGEVIFDNGLYKVAYLSTDNCYYMSSGRNYTGCNQNYDISNVKHIVDNWTIGMINVSDTAIDEKGYSSRLIDSDDLTDLGYISIQANTFGQDNFKAGNDTPEFMLNDNTNGMLTMIPSYVYKNWDNVLYYGIAVADDGYSFVAKDIPDRVIGTVRPVVTLNKKEIAPKITNVEEIEDTVSNDSESNNIEVDIETNVDNSNVVTDMNTNLNNSLSVVVPNTLSGKNIVLIIIGIIISVVGVITFIKFKRK